MSYTKPDKVEDGLESSFVDNTDPLMVNYRALGMNGYVHLRFLRLDSDTIFKYKAVRAKTYSPKRKTPLMLTYPNPGPPYDAELIDQDGISFANAPDENRVSMNRVPVFVFETVAVDKNGDLVKTEVNKLMWLEILPVMRKALKALQNNPQYGFNPVTKRPDYDMLLKVVPVSSGKAKHTYDIEPLTLLTVKGQRPQPHPNFSVEAEEAIGKDLMETEVNSNWDTVVESMKTLMSVEEIKKALAPVIIEETKKISTADTGETDPFADE